MTQKEKLEQLTGDKFPDPGEPLIIKEPIPGTPFWAIGQETGWNLIMGKYRINKEPLESYQATIKWLEENKWNVILSIAIAVTYDPVTNKTNN